MKIYTFGAEDAPVLLLLPGTCCHWKSNFGAVIPLLADSFRVLCVSYDGFDLGAIGAVLTILAAGIVVPALSYLLSFAAGAMLYVVVEELIPEMSQGQHSNVGTVFLR